MTTTLEIIIIFSAASSQLQLIRSYKRKEQL